MARAVIKLAGDIRSSIPQLTRKIEGCAYNPEAGQAAFRKDDMVVVIYPNEINICKIENEAAARGVMKWLMELLDHKD